MELHGEVGRLLLDAAELVDEIHVPGAAPELPVGGALQADLLLQVDRLAHGRILDRLQLIRREAAVGVVGARLPQGRRTQEAADVVGAERRLGSPGHAGRLARGSTGNAPARNP